MARSNLLGCLCYRRLSVRLLLLLSSEQEKTKEESEAKTQKESIRTQTGFDDNHHQNNSKNSRNNLRNNATNVRNPNTITIDNPKTIVKITCNGNHDEVHRRLAILDQEKEEEDHTRRCLARDGEDINAEDFSKDALVRIVRNERAKHAQELELVQAENAFLRRKLEPPPTPIQDNGKSQEKLKEIIQLKKTHMKEIKQIEDDYAGKLSDLQNEHTVQNADLSRSRGTNSSQEEKITQYERFVTAMQQEFTQLIVALLWINQITNRELVPALKKILPNLPLEQFTTAQCNDNTQFPLFRWVLYNTLPNYTFTCPCNGSPAINPDILRDQLPLSNSGAANTMPNHGLTNGLSVNNSTPQTIYGSTGYVAPINQPQPYPGNRATQGISLPQTQHIGPVIPQITITPPYQQHPTTGISQTTSPLSQGTTHPSFETTTLKPLPQTTTPRDPVFEPITGLDKLDEPENTQSQPHQWTLPDKPGKDELRSLPRYRRRGY